jgi:CheY-like chemotaxis protein
MLVLVVDDDLDIRCTIAQVLREEGFRVREARDGRDALAKIEEEMPDLLLLDLMMPVMSGWQLLETLRDTPHCRTLPVIILSAAPPTGEITEGCADYIEKPVSFDRLVRLVESVHANAGDGAPSSG